ncbi:MAG: hypothetical protein O2895_04780 [Chloroflexi bacterium]|nr:hypothetical protein [Chloroflexota bacterium]
MRRPPKYEPLRAWLAAQPGPKVTVSFSTLDDLVGGLPASARLYPVYWYGTAAGSKQRHTWKRAWEDAGFVMDSFDLGTEQVTFRRA